MSDFSNKNVHFFAPYLHIFELISRVDFSQPKCVGRLKSTLLATVSFTTTYCSIYRSLQGAIICTQNYQYLCPLSSNRLFLYRPLFIGVLVVGSATLPKKQFTHFYTLFTLTGRLLSNSSGRLKSTLLAFTHNYIQELLSG